MNIPPFDWSSLKKRYIGMDLFRILSALSVCMFHTTIHLGANYGFFQGMSRMSAFFMTAFFMMSGFNLFVNYAGNDIMRIDRLKSFWKKRMYHMAPMYFVVAVLFIAFYYISALRTGGSYSLYNELVLAPIEILGLQSNFHSIFNYSHNGGTWFISCILMCYLVYPLLQETAKQLSTGAKCICIAACAFVLMYAPLIVRTFDTVTIYANPFFRILEFTIGIMLAALKPQLDKTFLARKKGLAWGLALLAYALMAVLVIFAVRAGFALDDYMAYSVICLPCFAVMTAALSLVESKTLLKSKWIARCCDMAYVFFLSQAFSNTICKWLIAKWSITSNGGIIALSWMMCVLIAIGLYEGIEKPLQKVLRRKAG